MEKLTPVIGWTGFALGVVTAICAMLPGWSQFIALGTMFLGLLLCSLYILFSSRYRIESKWINPGYTGILLNSTPLILIIYFALSK